MMREEKILPWVTVIAAVLIGTLLGGGLITLQAGKTIDRLYAENQSLKQQLAQIQTEHQTLEEQLNKKEQQPVIRKIAVNMLNGGPDWLNAQVTDRINHDLRFLLGRKLSSLYEAPEIIGKLLDNRIYEIENGKYQINVETVVISPTLTIWVTVRKAD